MTRPVITIDGHAGSGKTSISRGLAARLGWAYLSSGLLYRGVGLLAIRRGVPFQDESRLVRMLQETELRLSSAADGSNLLTINGLPEFADLQAPELSEAASLVAQLPGVRTLLVQPQREAFPGRGLVAEGRDMGTVIFPDASLKLLVSAPAELRAARRLQQLGGAGLSSEALVREILERDARDSGREVAPTRVPEGGAEILNDGRPLTEVVEDAYALAARRGIV